MRTSIGNGFPGKGLRLASVIALAVNARNQVLSLQVAFRRTMSYVNLPVCAPSLALCLFAFGVCGEQRNPGPVASGNTNSAMEQFKAFVGHPPIVADLVFERKAPTWGGPAGFGGNAGLPSPWEYYQARWQPGAVFFRKLSSPSDVTNTSLAGQLVSSFGGTNWLVEPVPRFNMWNDADPTVKGKDYSIFYTRAFYLGPLRELLNLGVMHVEPGAIRWIGNRFRVESDVDVDHWIVSGELREGTNGYPEKLNVRYELGAEVDHYVLRYGFRTTPGGAVIPTGFTNYWMGNGQEVEVSEAKILSLDLATHLSPAKAFDAGEFVKGNGWPIRVYASNAFYTLTNGTLHFLGYFPPKQSAPAGESRLGRRSLYVGWVGMNLALFTLIVRVKKLKP